MTYNEAEKLLQGRCRNRRKLQNNTYLERRDPSSIAIRLHTTDIITLHRDGSFRLDSGGWNTPTTRDRINRYIPRHRVWTERGVMFLVRTLRRWRWNWDEYQAGRMKTIRQGDLLLIPIAADHGRTALEHAKIRASGIVQEGEATTTTGSRAFRTPRYSKCGTEFMCASGQTAYPSSMRNTARFAWNRARPTLSTAPENSII